MGKDIVIKHVTHEEIFSMANFHIEGISEGFISSLGSNFVLALYEAISKDDNSFCLIAEESGKALGFVAFSKNLNKLFKSIIKRNGFKFVLAIGLRIFRPSVCKRVIQDLFYPTKTSELNLPQAELLSIVVDPAYQGKGIAKQLCLAGLEECRIRGIDKVKVLVAASNETANKLYKKCGFELLAEVDSHSIPSNIYVADLTK